jgi:hypothetical protein
VRGLLGKSFVSDQCDRCVQSFIMLWAQGQADGQRGGSLAGLAWIQNTTQHFNDGFIKYRTISVLIEGRD